MVSVTQLWLPILVSSVAVFFASFLAWMVLPHHKKDIKTLPKEKEWAENLKLLNLSPGIYMWPGCDTPEEMKSAEYKQRYKDGPWGSVTILGAQPNFGRNLLLVFLFYVVVGIFVSYLAGQGRAAGASFSAVFQMAGTAAIAAYCAGSIPNALFFGKPGRFVLTDFIDALVYGLITGLIFAWLWPSA